MEKEIEDKLRLYVEQAPDKLAAIQEIRAFLHELSPMKDQPVDFVRWVPIEKVAPNDYNPNNVAQSEMQLLVTSIEHDGYTQPVVTVQDLEKDNFRIVDGFHRYFVGKNNKEINERCGGLIPITIITKDINDRMASTIRHNRARGRHNIVGMSNMVFALLDNGWGDAEICNELGMEPEELLRLKHITGFSKLFADAEYNRAWMTRRQIIIKKKYEDEQREATNTK